jgi:hypothetical protein
MCHFAFRDTVCVRLRMECSPREKSFYEIARGVCVCVCLFVVIFWLLGGGKKR